MNLSFQKATKKESRLRCALIGASGSGKTYTALAIASGLSDKIAVVDTEHGSASKYADIFDFSVINLDSYSPGNFIDCILAAQNAGFEILIIDSLSHAWMGKDGVLERHDTAAKRTQNSYTAWRDVTPQHNNLVEAILQSKLHIITTLRAKTEYVMEKDERGKTSVRKVGLAPVQKDGLEYEFDVVGTLDFENNLIIDKSRFSPLSGRVFTKAGHDVAIILKQWLDFEKTESRVVSPIQKSVTERDQTKAEKKAKKPVTEDTPVNEEFDAQQRKLIEILYNEIGVTDEARQTGLTRAAKLSGLPLTEMVEKTQARVLEVKFEAVQKCLSENQWDNTDAEKFFADNGLSGLNLNEPSKAHINQMWELLRECRML